MRKSWWTIGALCLAAVCFAPALSGCNAICDDSDEFGDEFDDLLDDDDGGDLFDGVCNFADDLTDDDDCFGESDCFDDDDCFNNGDCFDDLFDDDD